MWTNDQQNAIDAPVSNLLVTAAAGSGKTAVMAERIVKRILSGDGVDVDKLLVVTFTNAAASEIKERIHLKILEQLDKNRNSALLNRQLALIDNASICTIHSFCLKLIKENFNALGIDPDVKTGDTNQVARLLDTAVDNVFGSYYDENDENFLHLIKLYSPKTDKRFAEIIKMIYNFSRTMPSPEKWRKSLCETYADKKTEEHKKILFEKCKIALNHSVKLYEKIFAVCRNHDVTGALIDFVSAEKEFYVNLISRLGNWQNAFEYVQNTSFPRLSPKISKENDKTVMEEINALRTEAKEARKMCALVFDCGEDGIFSDFEKYTPYVQKLIEIVDKTDAEFVRLKREKNIIDFSDYEHLALKILKNDDGTRSKLAEEISKNYAEIYVDEYQDCNEIQDEIFSLVSNGKNVFMVGDVKQSIYKFRDAAPMIFKNKIDTFSPFDKDNYNENVKIKLSKNFRSRKTVLDGVNVLFSKIMSDDVGEMNYTKDDFLYENENEFYGDDLYKKITVNVIEYEKNCVSEDDEETAEADKCTMEANFTAGEIERLVNDENAVVYDKSIGKKRRITYRDIVVLMRAKGDGAVFENAFSARGIPCFSESGGEYYETSEIKTLLCLAKVSLNPLDDIEITAVMRSGIYKFNDEELLTIRLCLKDTYFYDAMVKYAKLNSDKLAEKISNFLGELNRFSEAAKHMPSDEFFRLLVRKTDYLSYVGTLKNAGQKKANIRALFYKAECFEKTAYQGIFNFLRFVDDITLKKSDGDAPKIVSENDNVVRIMTIHKSKGLEFGAVFLCQCAKKINFCDTSGAILLHKSLGLGLNFVDYEKRFSYPAITKKAIAEKMTLETLSEEERILYVALTRAKEKLYISACTDNAQKKIDNFNKILKLYNDTNNVPIVLTKGAKCYLDWIIPSLIRHFDENGDIFELNIIPSHTVEILDNAETTAETDFFGKFENVPNEFSDFVEKRLSYEYAYKSAQEFPSLLTVTELKRLLSENDDGYNIYEENILPSPEFLEEEKISAAHKGTLMHFAMQKIDFSDADSAGAVECQISKLCSDGLLTSAEAECIDCEKIVCFANSEIGEQIKNSAVCEREFSFKIPVKLSEIFDTGAQDVIIVQGAIDLFFEESDGSVVLIDYKTDRVKNAEKIREKYEIQLKIYKTALEKILKKRVSKTMIYLFDTGEFI